ncbi:MAG: hypothetical protein DMF79_19325 [Acidobacteria bacterium]|nr:MAG: hypothetical protein DMF79_19325 [Acidobacteriota bacterium]
MIRSMTGYGSAAAESAALRATVTVRSLNHRFLELIVHLSRRLLPLEREIKDLVQSCLSRGRVEVSVQASFPAAETGDVVVASRPLVASFVRTLRSCASRGPWSAWRCPSRGRASPTGRSCAWWPGPSRV